MRIYELEIQKTPLQTARFGLATLVAEMWCKNIPQLIENHQAKGEKLASDIPILQKTAAGVWKKENELKDLKSEVAALERKITLSLKPIDQSDNSQEQGKDEKQGQKNDTPSIAGQNDDKSAGAKVRM